MSVFQRKPSFVELSFTLSTTSILRAQKQSRSSSAEVAGTVVWFGTAMLSLVLSSIAQLTTPVPPVHPMAKMEMQCA